MKTLAVIIPVYLPDEPTRDLVEHCVDAVLANVQHPKFHTTIRVVDDGSPLKLKPRPQINVTTHRENRGIAVAWNTGMWNEPEADFYCWLNGDCEVTSGWAYPLVVAAEQLKCIAMPYTNGEKSDGLGITGWCFLTTADLARTIGPFDETFVPARYEDTDWFHRAIYQHKIPLVNVPASNVRHERAQGGTKAISQMDLLHQANLLRYCWKHHLDPSQPPPFWTRPLPEVEIEG